MGRVRFTQAARKHKVAAGRARQVLAQPYVVVPQPRPDGRPDMLMHLGDDITGRPLEVGVVELADGTHLVIHAMDLRGKYRDLYERGKQQTEEGGQA